MREEVKITSKYKGDLTEMIRNSEATTKEWVKRTLKGMMTGKFNLKVEIKGIMINSKGEKEEES